VLRVIAFSMQPGCYLQTANRLRAGMSGTTPQFTAIAMKPRWSQISLSPHGGGDMNGIEPLKECAGTVYAGLRSGVVCYAKVVRPTWG